MHHLPHLHPWCQNNDNPQETLHQQRRICIAVAACCVILSCYIYAGPTTRRDWPSCTRPLDVYEHDSLQLVSHGAPVFALLGPGRVHKGEPLAVLHSPPLNGLIPTEAPCLVSQDVTPTSQVGTDRGTDTAL